MITETDIIAVANTLKAQNILPSVRKVRSALGGGDVSRIAKVLKAHKLNEKPKLSRADSEVQKYGTEAVKWRDDCVRMATERLESQNKALREQIALLECRNKTLMDVCTGRTEVMRQSSSMAVKAAMDAVRRGNTSVTIDGKNITEILQTPSHERTKGQKQFVEDQREARAESLAEQNRMLQKNLAEKGPELIDGLKPAQVMRLKSKDCTPNQLAWRRQVENKKSRTKYMRKAPIEAFFHGKLSSRTDLEVDGVPVTELPSMDIETMTARQREWIVWNEIYKQAQEFLDNKQAGDAIEGLTLTQILMTKRSTLSPIHRAVRHLYGRVYTAKYRGNMKARSA